MKHYLPLVFALITSISFSQITWTGAATDNFWNSPANWDSGTVPMPVDDVIIPTNFTVAIDLPGVDVQSIDLEGNSTLTVAAGNMVIANTFMIDSNATFNWRGNLTGGAVITNNGTINLGNSNGTLSSIVSPVSMFNSGTINLPDIGDIFIATGCSLTNNSGATINFESTATGISRSGATPHTLTNLGTLRVDTPNTTDQVLINVQLLNNSGIVDVVNGVLNLDSDSLGSIYNGGVFNTTVGSQINVLDNTEIVGTFTGMNEGTFNLPDVLTIQPATTTTLDLSGNGIIKFNPTLQGGGTFINKSVLTMEGFPTFIIDGTTLLNQSLIDFTAAGDIFIGTGSTLNNDSSGTIEFRGDTGNIQASNAPPHTFLNSGIIRADFAGDGSDTAQISAELNNTGTIDISNGTLILFNNSNQLNDGNYIINTDGIFEWSNTVTISGSIGGSINGNGILKWNGKVNVPVAASLDFGGTGEIDWFNGNIDGGGILTNNNVLNIGNSSNAFIYGGTTLNNNNTINFTSNDDLLIETGGVLNNQMTGAINFFADGSVIGINGIAPRTVNNMGSILVDLPNPDDNVSILCEFNNNDANIEILSGTLNFNNSTKDAQNLIDGVYNIELNGAMDWDGNITLSGILTGNIQGLINWRSVVWVNSPNTATLDFAGQERIDWVSGSLNGGGTLINRSEIDIVSTGNVSISGATTFNNGDELNLTTFGDLALTMNSTLNNLVDGDIELQVPAGNIILSGPGPHFFNNVGTLTADSGGINVISVDTVVNSGLIDIASGELEINANSTFLNDSNGIIKGEGVFDIPISANFTNDGTIAPGASPGTLTVIGDYTSTNTSKLEIEIDGLVQGSEFDFIPITGNDVVFDGVVDVTLGFDANVNDEFIISTTTGTILGCNIQTPAFASFGGFDYEFDVICRNGNELVLVVLNETLSIDSIDLNDSITLFPNPASEYVIIRNESLIELEYIDIVDVRGRLVLQEFVRETEEYKRINLNHFQSGIYFMRVKTARGNLIKRLVIK